MADVPISNALIDSAQFQIQSVEPETTGAGLVRLFRAMDVWAEKRDDGTVRKIESGVLLKTVSVSSADLLALDTVPKLLVESPGPGKSIIPLLQVFAFDVGATPYAGASTLHTIYGTVLAAGSASDQFAFSGPGGWANGEARIDLAYTNDILATVTQDKPLSVILSDPITGGDGTAVIYLVYIIV